MLHVAFLHCVEIIAIFTENVIDMITNYFETANLCSTRFSGTVIEKFVSVEKLYDRYHGVPSMPIPWHINSEQIKFVDISRLHPKQAYDKKKEEYQEKIRKIIEAYEKWIDDLSFYKEREPNLSEYEREITTIKDILHYINSDMNPDRFFKNNHVDIDLCGKYLQRMKDDWLDEDEEDFVCMMAACEWVLSKMGNNNLVSSSSSFVDEGTIQNCNIEKDSKERNVDTLQVNELEDEETLFLRFLMKELKLQEPLSNKVKYDDFEFTTNQVLFAVFQYCEDENFECAKSVLRFSTILQPLIASCKTVDSIQHRIGRVNVRDYNIGKVRLKDLSEESIKSELNINILKAKNRFKKWAGLYDFVSKSAQKYKSEKPSLEKINCSNN